MEKLGTVALSPDILNKANIGLWAFELDEGCAPKMYADETMLGLLGLKQPTDPEQVYHAWYDNVDDAHYQTVNDAVAKMAAGEHAEVQYPWHDPEKGVIYVRCGGIRNFAYKKGIRIEGTHQDITALLHYQNERMDKLMRVNQEKLRRMQVFTDYFIDSFVSAYYVGLDDMSVEIFRASESITKMLGNCSDCREFIENYINEYVHPEDREVLKTLTVPSYIKDRLKKEDSFSFIYREMSESEDKSYRGIIIRGADEDHVAVGFIDMSEELAVEKKRQQFTISLLHALSGNYRIIFYVDAGDGSYSIYSPDYKSGLSGMNTVYSDFFTAVKSGVNIKIHPDDKPTVERYCSGSGLEAALTSNQECSFEIRVMTESGYKWFRVKAVRVTDDNGRLKYVIGARDLTGEKEKEASEKRSADIIEAISSEFTSLYYVDLDTEELIPYVMNENTRRMLGDLLLSGVKYSEAYKVYTERMVAPSDKVMMQQAGSISFVRSKLSGQKSFSRKYINNDGRYFEMKFVKMGDASSEPHRVALGFADKDSELRRELDQQAVIRGLASDYALVVYVDPNTEKDNIYFSESKYSNIIHGWDIIDRFDDRLEAIRNSVVHPDDRDMFGASVARDKVIEELRYNPAYYVNYRCLIRSRIEYWQVKFVLANTMEDRIVAAFRSVDAETRIQFEQNEKLEAALNAAEAANRAKTTFLNNMSHDIRTPMNAIIGFTGLAQKHSDNRELLEDYLSKIEKSSDHLLALINDVLDMSRIESGRMNIVTNAENLSDIIHNLCSIVQADVDRHALEFSLNCANIRNEDIICDKLRINQVLLNILSNAIKYTAPGGRVSVNVSQLDTAPEGFGRYEFRISDTGIGMSPEFLNRAFTPFTRMQTSTISGIQGTGLGLAITRSLVELMGGTISIDSHINVGTLVKILITFRLQQNKQDESILASLAGKRVLIVDDDDDCLEGTRGMLTDLNLTAEGCRSGDEAVELTDKEPYDLYIIDERMPETDGINTIARLRRRVGWDVPMLLFTAYDISDVENDAVAAGATGLLSKPLFPSDLKTALLRYCAPEMVNEDDDGEGDEVFDFTGKRLLLVEDNELNREIAEDILSERGFIIETAEDGTVAVDKVKNAAAGYYDMVLMDIQMPLMDGYEATRRIRALDDPGKAGVIIVAMTANAFAEDRRMAINAGMNEHVPKPIDPQRLMRVLAKFLN